MGGSRRRSVSVWAAALAVHVAALGWFGWRLGIERESLLDPDRGAASPGAAAGSAPAADAALAMVELAEVELIADPAAGPPLEAMLGAADQVGFDQEHPLPGAPLDLPGDRAAGAGGGDPVAGAPAVTGRRDRTLLRSQIWNDPLRTLLPRRRTAHDTASPEWIARRPRTAADERDARSGRAREGAEHAVRGAPGARGEAGAVAATPEPVAERAWREADPRFDPGAPPVQPARAHGAIRPESAHPLVARGPEATEADRRGPVRDATDSAAASSARHPMPLELTRPSAGGTAEEGGVRGGPARPGAVADSPARGTGTASARADRPRGPGRPAIRATRQDPYFRRMYERLDRQVVFPRDLAIALEQGEVVVVFQLRVEDGAIHDPRVVKSSGFEGFDRELTRALVAAGPFGPVPASLRGAADRLVVTAPYWFRNPLVR